MGAVTKPLRRKKRARRAGSGKSKGNGFERQICKTLSLWITAGRRDDVLWRSAISGGRATVAAKKGRELPHVAGDVCAVHPDGSNFVDNFYVECKCYKDLQLASALLRGEGKLIQFWKETAKQAARHGKKPMLIFKQNLFPTHVALDPNTIALGTTARLGLFVLVPLASLIETPMKTFCPLAQPRGNK